MRAVQLSDGALLWAFAARLVDPPRGRFFTEHVPGGEVDDVALSALLCTWSVACARGAGAISLTVLGPERVAFSLRPGPAAVPSSLDAKVLSALVEVREPGWDPPVDLIDLVIPDPGPAPVPAEVAARLAAGPAPHAWVRLAREEMLASGIVSLRGLVRKRPAGDLAELEGPFAEVRARRRAFMDDEKELHDALFTGIHAEFSARTMNR